VGDVRLTASFSKHRTLLLLARSKRHDGDGVLMFLPSCSTRHKGNANCKLHTTSSVRRGRVGIAAKQIHRRGGWLQESCISICVDSLLVLLLLFEWMDGWMDESINQSASRLVRDCSVQHCTKLSQVTSIWPRAGRYVRFSRDG
jgi:hypothetical protein